MSYDPEQAKLEMNRRKLEEKWTGAYTPRTTEATRIMSQHEAKHISRQGKDAGFKPEPKP